MQIEAIHQLKELFAEVQMQQVFPDGKTFPDCLPKHPLDEIEREYEEKKAGPLFSLKTFVHDNFSEPPEHTTEYAADSTEPVQNHIEHLWDVLTRRPEDEKSTLIPLPHPYIVPGGRFREIYYWDSYFTMLGLQVSGRVDMIENMVKNFTFLINKVGHIPNGNRLYYTGRSQPPFYALMVQLLREEKGENVLVTALPALEKEYAFWMKGKEKLSEENIAVARVVRMADGAILNRYWDEYDTPRPEAYREDVELALDGGRDARVVYRNLRAGAESGWDFSSRWFKDGSTFETIHVTCIIPVDLNCLLLHLEQTLAEANTLAGKRAEASAYTSLVIKRKLAIERYCWNTALQFYTDYDFEEDVFKQDITMAGAFPLFFGAAPAANAEKVASVLHAKLLKNGGCVTTLTASGQQWDSPNGWAPLQYIAIKGLEKYNMFHLAAEIAKRWISLNIKVFKATGKLMEKYNVVDTNLLAGGGEYPSQDGFGWTNGVLLKLMQMFKVKG
jgi:alpha,alpha-trehalase